ncbi:MAG TPA: DUF2267 domain-containing protein [Kofleriaceae bacterium]
MAKPHVFDAHLEVAKRWLSELMTNLDLSPAESPRALHALRAGLHAIRDRLPANEVLDLGAQLPTLIRGFYYEGWTLRTQPRQIRDRAAMIARVKKELEPDQHLDPIDVLRAVIHLVVEHVSAGEIEDVLATIPKSIRALWHDLAGHAAQLPPVPAQRERLTRRTGYSR